MWRVGKVLRLEGGKNLNPLPSVKKTLGKLSFLLSAKNNTLGKELFVKCEEKTLGKNSSLPSVFILPSVFLITLGKELFTECSK